MIVFPLIRLAGLKAATASSRVAILPMFVRRRPSRTRWAISFSWARSDSTTKSIVRPSAGRASVGPAETRPADGLAVDFVVESDRAQLSEIVQRVRDGRLRTNIGNVSTLDKAIPAFNSTERRTGKTVIRVRP